MNPIPVSHLFDLRTAPKVEDFLWTLPDDLDVDAFMAECYKCIMNRVLVSMNYPGELVLNFDVRMIRNHDDQVSVIGFNSPVGDAQLTIVEITFPMGAETRIASVRYHYGNSQEDLMASLIEMLY